MIDQHIAELKADLNKMAGISLEITDLAIVALQTGDKEQANNVIVADSILDQLEIKIDIGCMKLLALQEPYAVDFRFVFSAIKTSRDLERVGDECKTVAKWCTKVSNIDEDILTLAKKAREALDVSIKALMSLDIELAKKALEIEFTVDAIEDRIINSTPNVPVAFIAKALERIGDMATNIAENVIFSVEAKDIRHGHYQQ